MLVKQGQITYDTRLMERITFRAADKHTKRVCNMINKNRRSRGSEEVDFDDIWPVQCDRLHIPGTNAWAYVLHCADGTSFTVAQARSKHARFYEVFFDDSYDSSRLVRWAERITREERFRRDRRFGRVT